MREGCMSVPDYTGNVTRAESIVVEFLDQNCQHQVISADGFEAIAIQHELDHLDGHLFLDRVSSLKPTCSGARNSGTNNDIICFIRHLAHV